MPSIKENIYHELVGHFYAHVEKEFGCLEVSSRVKGVQFTLTREVICEILKIRSGEEKKEKDVDRKDQLSSLYGEESNENEKPI